MSSISATGSINKFNANFSNLQTDVIARLFKSYCCSFHGCQTWRIDSFDYKRVCTTWSNCVRNILRGISYVFKNIYIYIYIYIMDENDPLSE